MITISLGAVMSRAIVGASDFIPVVVCCFVIVGSKAFGRLVEGEKILLFEDGVFLKENMKRALVCQEDLMQGSVNRL